MLHSLQLTSNVKSCSVLICVVFIHHRCLVVAENLDFHNAGVGSNGNVQMPVFSNHVACVSKRIDIGRIIISAIVVFSIYITLASIPVCLRSSTRGDVNVFAFIESTVVVFVKKRFTAHIRAVFSCTREFGGRSGIREYHTVTFSQVTDTEGSPCTRWRTKSIVKTPISSIRVNRNSVIRRVFRTGKYNVFSCFPIQCNTCFFCRKGI